MRHRSSLATVLRTRCRLPIDLLLSCSARSEPGEKGDAPRFLVIVNDRNSLTSAAANRHCQGAQLSCGASGRGRPPADTRIAVKLWCVPHSRPRLGGADREQPRGRPARAIVGTFRCAVSGRAPPAHDGWLGAGGDGGLQRNRQASVDTVAGCRPGGRHGRLRVHHCQAHVVADGLARFPRTGDETGAAARQSGHSPCGPLRAASPSPSAPGWIRRGRTDRGS